MRRHAKASTAGTTQRQATGFGRIFRGALATRGASSDVDGSSAPKARRLALLLAAFVIILAFAVGSANASKTHLFKEIFGSAAQPSFGNDKGMAVDQSSGRLLVIDSSAGTVSRYNPDGTPANFSSLGTNVIDGQGGADLTPQNGLSFGGASEVQVAVDNSGAATDGNIYVTQSNQVVVDIFASTGTYLGQLSAAGVTPFGEPCGVAVDSTGAVYVGDYSSGVHKFVPAANPPVNADNTTSFTAISNPCTLAAGAGATAGFIFVTKYNDTVSKLDSSTGELKYVVASGANTTASVDPVTGHVYVVQGSEVVEYDASGAGSATTVSSVTAGGTVEGVAVRGSNSDLYIARSGTSNVDVYGPLVTLPSVTTGAASSIEPTSATLNGTINPDGVELSECKFEYGKTTAYGQSIPCEQSPATIGSGTSDVAVSANLAGLELGAEYHFRLVAKNPNGTASGADSAFKLKSPPVIKETWAQDVLLTEAMLKAKINPEGLATTYKFEWGTTVAYGNSSTESGAGSDQADHVVSIALEELQPDTTYHYRVVATNSVGTAEGPDRTITTFPPPTQDTDCPNQQVRTGPAVYLPDCRAYELVSPLNKSGDIIARKRTIDSFFGYSQGSLEGSKVTYSAFASSSGADGRPYTSQFLSSRGADGWSTDNITPARDVRYDGPGVSELFTEYLGFSPDLSAGWARLPSNLLDPAAPQDYTNVFRRDNLDGSYEALITTAPPDLSSPQNLTPFVQGFSNDLSHVVFSSTGALTPEAALLGGNLGDIQAYEWVDGDLRLVSILPNGEPNSQSSTVGASHLLAPVPSSNLFHAISDDGSRIFWTSSTPFGTIGVELGKLYVRIDGQDTVAVSESVSTSPARFWGASADGSKALFSFPGSQDLYEFDVDTETPTLIAGQADGNFTGGVLGASDDLSYVYFISRQVLDAGASAGEANLYLRHEGSNSFITTLPNSDAAATSTVGVDVGNAESRKRSSRVTPDGRHVVFMSKGSLTSYDNTDAVNGLPNTEVFRYDADTQELTCVSCNPSRGRPVGFKSPSGEESIAARIPTWESPLYQQRSLSDDGSRVFFESYDALLPQDSNGKIDVYQWEAQGSGGCQKASGCISLISTGMTPDDAEFVDASPSGGDVFVATSGSLDPRDTGLIDVYDARVNGGYPVPPTPIPCVADACHDMPEPSIDPTPASANFRGPGNPIPQRNCGAAAKRAVKLSRQAKRARRKSPRRSAQLAERAKQLGKQASRCRRANRGASR